MKKLFILAILILLLACSKEYINRDFIGTWVAVDTTDQMWIEILEIDPPFIWFHYSDSVSIFNLSGKLNDGNYIGCYGYYPDSSVTFNYLLYLERGELYVTGFTYLNQVKFEINKYFKKEY